MQTPNHDIQIDLAFPPPEKILAGTISQLGYPGADAVSDRVLTEIRSGIDRCRELAVPAVIYRSTPFEEVSQKTIAGKNLILTTVNWSRLTRRMTGVYELFCLAVTLGQAVDETIRMLSRDTLLQALTLDTAASVLAEAYADQIQQQVRNHYQQKGLQASARFSPGYCDWPLQNGQKALFDLLTPATIGLRVNASGLMTPRKSVSAVILAAEQMPASTPCFLCARECSHRRSPYCPDQPKNLFSPPAPSFDP